MTIERYEDIQFGDELGDFTPDVSMAAVVRFTEAAQMNFSRFTDHEEARKSGLPGAIVPGIMSQGILAAMIHRWAPKAEILRIDTIFRAPLVVDSPLGFALRQERVVRDDDAGHGVNVTLMQHREPAADIPSTRCAVGPDLDGGGNA